MEPTLLSIMLVDDDNVDVESFLRTLRKIDFKNPLFIAHDGVEALEMLKGTNGREKIYPTPKVIITDINMPKMNGLELLKELRADKDLRAISIYILTTSNYENDRIEAYNYNVAGYILKPIDMEGLVNIASILFKYWHLCFESEV